MIVGSIPEASKNWIIFLITLKILLRKNNFPPTVMQIAEELKYDVETEVKPAIEELVAKVKIKFESSKGKIIEIIE